MKKAISAALALVFLLSAFFFPVVSLAESETSAKDANVEEVNSFDLFWPIVAGKTSEDSLYWLKSLKENLRESLIFSKYKKVDYNILMAEKRAVEFENLVLEKKNYSNAEKTLTLSKERRSKVLSLLKELESEGTNTTDLKNRFRSSLENQTKLGLAIQSKVTDQAAKDVVKAFLTSLTEDTANLK